MRTAIKIPRLLPLNFPFHRPVARDFFIFVKKLNNDQNSQHNFSTHYHGFCRMRAISGRFGQGKV